MIFATLGPAGSNHAFVLERYLTRHYARNSEQHATGAAAGRSSGRSGARAIGGIQTRLFPAFPDAFEALLAGQVDRVLQCTAHFSHAECVGRFMHRAFPVDTFIASSRPLALLASTSVAKPRTVALQPATRHYTDLTAFAEQIEVETVVAAAEGLLAGSFDAAICARELLERHRSRFRLLKDLGPALDVWVIYATTPPPDTSPLVLP